MSRFGGRALVLDWKSMPEGKEKYHAYLASPEWAVRKEAVKARSGGTCEHCRRAPGTQTHHMTYLRKYAEPLADLLHVCEPCHLFLSGKSKEDPSKTLVNYVFYKGSRIEDVYLAGKITGTNWRDEIAPGWSCGGISCFSNNCPDEVGDSWDHAHGVIPVGDWAALNMTGPFWIDLNWGHGSATGNLGIHANGECCEHGSDITDRDTVLSRIQFAIASADLFFAWIDSKDCFGTLVEIGIAKGMRVPIVLASPWPDHEDEGIDLWMAHEIAGWQIVASSPGLAWEALCAKRFCSEPPR